MPKESQEELGPDGLPGHDYFLDAVKHIDEAVSNKLSLEHNFATFELDVVTEHCALTKWNAKNEQIIISSFFIYLYFKKFTWKQNYILLLILWIIY